MTSNTPEYSVSELAYSLKRSIEEQFGHVRVRGELGRVTIARSGHCYLDVKDDKAVINSIIWKGVMGRLSMQPEEGMEVVCEGKLSTYPGRSNYQLIIDKMELAGAGALMALYEKRKKALAAEGLFDAGRKVPLPFMPKTIGVVTSQTGAVIRDILHRISDRFPSHVLVWPVLVQGDKAAEQIAAAITGFNHAAGFPKPDVLIVARGGGSMEDLWCFNEEVVARAAAASTIPLISAVGHETDWTLIDYVADYRAPTPTGAAEVAVPVMADWVETLADYGLRLSRGLRRSVTERQNRLKAARLPRLETVLAPAQQRLDLASARLPSAQRLYEPQRNALALQRLPSMTQILARASERLIQREKALQSAMRFAKTRYETKLKQDAVTVSRLGEETNRSISRYFESQSQRLSRASKLLEAYSYQGVLERGYALVQDENGKVVRSKESVSAGQSINLTFADGRRQAVIAGGEVVETVKPKPLKARKPKPTTQQDLF
ncbi:exodeoxyribonuclease VII large subunit [Litorimonas taeanensis]|uniref:Exodeoxyribonuclease 7 large subunit n=1 Tax=Litorimonas taeanensis TaxID=568099 RepID=A0A420WFC8_9PROT|nr:exodeoxyribonuclease VII large subunit [Litorimonas taeanensis]RKQ69700.1 exodeoxyribonuclease VII large subunit [Litorimonas taeanensis]